MLDATQGIAQIDERIMAQLMDEDFGMVTPAMLTQDAEMTVKTEFPSLESLKELVKNSKTTHLRSVMHNM